MLDGQVFKKTIIRLVDAFLEDLISEFSLKTDLTLTEEEFNEMIGTAYDSSNGVVQDNIHTDEYVYTLNENVMKKLIIQYIKQPENRYTILEIQGFGEWVKNDDISS